ncbi:sn-glycerol-3-phosphate ABC transporter permease UgpA [Cobetia amphilecti]|jgi:sn-glycerol 3-phosphate transport system permease protein|uniref:sn-glycerol-3-phosphate transport system permease protein UgpA n=2 Tax=Cobetia TaxID=204286 RepID=A0ABT6USR8_9GAMM|nr:MULTISPECIES: sn-glycerol-3-phosphate ABC transporter permease UgpA [Cobetia]MBR9756231.1 sn-glycerol-3-phosphate ABC transporter permease UgpA [Gammaproteobacteria bacterium]TCJ25025.1 sn-glycerol-3-phosphate ABC transporter permease UgpA [Halomonas sp. GDM18]KGA01245.1 glycerol-3-phosphate transporter permease [Cobetia amphilecti]KPM82160.1 glycerol-3-phosphate transporter permease [Cobetia sp. UCD-24C]MBE2168201.1 sn-glycerol-3-phosphate ABC transporter permease UgpA [Cobetia sp. 2AS1]|tara:strand:- start:27190 stop:28065 length:876 start_codon:yes stop_codon:yes gene_type:complete
MAHFNRHPITPWILLAPQLLIVAVFFFWPAYQAIEQAFYVEDAFGLSREFTGLSNFVSVLSEPEYLTTLWTTTYFSFAVAFGAMALALGLAVLADRVLRGAHAYKTLLIWPYAVAPAVAGVLWLFLFDPTLGILPELLSAIGIDWNHKLNGDQAMLLVVLASIWKQMSYNFVFFLAGLQAIPKSLLEAAAMDRAGPWRRFWTITFPLLSPTSFFLLVMNVVYAFFETFGTIDATTQGGPAGSTRTLVYKVYEDGFVGQDLGSSAAQSVLLMVIVGVLTLIQFKYVEKKVQY